MARCCAALCCAILQNRGASFAVCNGVLLGTLLELLVVRGGPQGTLEAVTIVDVCHTKGKPCQDVNTVTVERHHRNTAGTSLPCT